MATKAVRVKFLRPVEGWGYEVGETYPFEPEFARQFGDAIEWIDPDPATVAAVPAGRAEYDDSEMVERLNKTLIEIRGQLRDTENALLGARARVAELEATVAAYAAGQSPVAPVAPVVEAAPAPVVDAPVTEAPVVDAPAPVVDTPAPVEAPTTKVDAPPVAPAPVAAAPAAPATPAASKTWRDTPTVALGIPSSLKTILRNGGFDTAGKISDGLEDGTLLLLEGIGEAKANQLREHIASLAK
jgi:hypothetical protein